MIPSMFSLDHRLAELRPTIAEQRVSRELRDAAEEPTQPARSVGEPARRWPAGSPVEAHSTRLATR